MFEEVGRVPLRYGQAHRIDTSPRLLVVERARLS